MFGVLWDACSKNSTRPKTISSEGFKYVYEIRIDISNPDLCLKISLGFFLNVCEFYLQELSSINYVNHAIISLLVTYKPHCAAASYDCHSVPVLNRVLKEKQGSMQKCSNTINKTSNGSQWFCGFIWAEEMILWGCSSITHKRQLKRIAHWLEPCKHSGYTDIFIKQKCLGLTFVAGNKKNNVCYCLCHFLYSKEGAGGTSQYTSLWSDRIFSHTT